MTGAIRNKIGIDSNVLTYLIETMSIGEYPTDSIANQKISLLRIFIYSDYTFYVPETVIFEYLKINNNLKRKLHEHFTHRLFEEISDQDIEGLEAKSLGYNLIHTGPKGYNDCRIVACAELYGCGYLLTYDDGLLKNLKGKTKDIKLCKPLDFWTFLNISKNANITRKPRASNPLSSQTWWRW